MLVGVVQMTSTLRTTEEALPLWTLASQSDCIAAHKDTYDSYESAQDAGRRGPDVLWARRAEPASAYIEGGWAAASPLAACRKPPS
jgi:hypothetical protein